MTTPEPQTPRLWTSSPIQMSRLPTAEDINPRIVAAFRDLVAEDFSSRTHFFGGRFENLYLDPERIPEVATLLDYAKACACLILQRAPESLSLGFWFNAQGPGQETSMHSHDENDEMLSGVYYVHVPKNSGKLVMIDGALSLRVRPKAGSFVFFPPSLPHRVEVNRSEEQRLSIAFNLGPARDEG